jgi:hypothetical protein
VSTGHRCLCETIAQCQGLFCVQLDALHLSLVILLRRPVTQQTKKRMTLQACRCSRSKGIHAVLLDACALRLVACTLCQPGRYCSCQQCCLSTWSTRASSCTPWGIRQLGYLAGWLAQCIACLGSHSSPSTRCLHSTWHTQHTPGVKTWLQVWAPALCMCVEGGQQPFEFKCGSQLLLVLPVLVSTLDVIKTHAHDAMQWPNRQVTCHRLPAPSGRWACQLEG